MHNIHNPIYRILIHNIYKNETITIQLQETTKLYELKGEVLQGDVTFSKFLLQIKLNFK